VRPVLEAESTLQPSKYIVLSVTGNGDRFIGGTDLLASYDLLVFPRQGNNCIVFLYNMFEVHKGTTGDKFAFFRNVIYLRNF
jgi:hypothetical protein